MWHLTGCLESRIMKLERDPTPFLRHVRACNNAVLPGRRKPFRIGRDRVGWVLPELAEALCGFPAIAAEPDGSVTLREPDALQAIVRALAERGLMRWRGEAFDIRARPGGRVLAQVDRGALPKLGIEAEGVHVNGLVEPAGEETQVWIARRSPHKQLDPGKLDHIVAGGVPAGLSPEATLVKEAAEEAAIRPAVVRTAVPVGVIAYAMERPEGLRLDRLHCYDLVLPREFTPRAADGEVETFELWPLSRVLATVRDTDEVKFNVNLVLIDLFLRRGLFVQETSKILRRELSAPRNADVAQARSSG
jgi:hypothetical protein